MRAAITAFFRLCLRIFYRRIEIVGEERIPANGAVVFACNHPNGLVDPLFLLCSANRPVSFLGKAPLFHYPVIGWFVRLFDTIPVYRKQDQTTGSNRETFARSREVLRGGGSIAIFPEGTTHDDPQLRELKSGAARIALGAGLGELFVVPTGIYYTAKQVFRSSALVVFGEPLRVVRATLDAEGEPSPEDAVRLTQAIDLALDEVTVQADSHDALHLVALAENIFSADAEQPLAEEFELRRRFVEGYHYLRTQDPRRLEKLQSAIVQFASALQRAKLDVHELKPRISAGRVFRVLVLLPVAVAGAMVNYVPYRLVGHLAKRFSKGESAVKATIQVLAALALYPITYAAVGLIAGWRFGWKIGLATAMSLPLLSYVALRIIEDMDDIVGDARALAIRMFRRYGYERLRAERYAIKQEMLAVAREMER